MDNFEFQPSQARHKHLAIMGTNVVNDRQRGSVKPLAGERRDNSNYRMSFEK